VLGGIDRTSYNEKDGVECNLFGFQAPANLKSLVLFARGLGLFAGSLQPVTRPVITVFDLFHVYLPLFSFEIVSSVLRNRKKL